MMRALFLIFSGGVFLFYAASSWFGWELANSGTNSRLSPRYYFLGGGFRGGK